MACRGTTKRCTVVARIKPVLTQYIAPSGPIPDLSEANDALHLATHLKAGRDYFVTTDQRIHGASKGLSELGVRVVTPDEALKRSRRHVRCQVVRISGAAAR
jgi:hypothetical protein